MFNTRFKLKINILYNMRIKRFQDGGAMTPEEAGMAPEQGAPMGGPEQGGDPTAQLQQMAQQVIEAIGPDAAMALAQMIIEMLQGGGGEAPAQPGMMRNGGHLTKKAGTLSNGQAYFKSY